MKATAWMLMVAGVLSTANPATAAEDAGQITPLTPRCIQAAASKFRIHPDVLLAILMVEGGTVGKNSRKNENGSYDIGPYQINSIHRAMLEQHGVSESLLRNNGCVNVTVAAWHLKRTLTPEVLSRVHDEDSYLKALALYHSATPKFNAIYAERLRAAFARLYASGDQ